MSWGTRSLRKKLRKALRARDGDRCHWCKLPMLFGIPIRHHPMLASIEHLTPRSCGGSNDLTNLALAHLACNHRRNELHQRLEQFQRYRAGRLPGIRRMTMESEALKATEAYSAARSTHPRVTLDYMKSKIADETYFTIGDALRALPNGTPVNQALDILTVCILVMENGFTIIGKSAPASPENFDEEKGKTFAYEDAIKQLWPLMGFALREELFAAGASKIDPGEGMRRYVGTKAINAKPMTRAAYNELRGWELPADENGDDAGYLVEYADGQRPNVEGFDGYVSWSPADVFEAAYR